MQPQRNQTALITGASMGIGLDLARQFAADHINLVLVARNEAKLNALKAEWEAQYAISVTVIAKDLARPGAARAVFDAVAAAGINVDYLVNNAGYGQFGLFKESSLDDELAMMHLNMTTLTEMTKLFLPPMLARKQGRVMNLASTAGFQPGPYMAVYYATKAYVLSFSEALAEELKGSGVTVTALCPGPTQSGFQDKAAMHDSGLVKGKKIMDSATVAKAGYAAMQRGKRVAIRGAMNWLMAQSVRFTPRAMVTALVAKMSEPR